MINKRFSLHDAYSFGVKTVTNHFGFFVVSLLLGACAAAVVLSFLGIIDYMMFKEHFEALINMTSEAMRNPMGVANYAGVTVHETVRVYLPEVVSKHLAPQTVLSIDLSKEDMMAALKMLVPAVLLFKLFLEVIAIGWTKIALDLQANKQVEYNYLYKFYALAPRVVVVELIKGVAMLVGLLLFVVPGIFIFQRLRFAKYFVIDKNQSIMDALKSSWNLTEGSVIHLVGYSIFAFCLMALGRLFFPAMFFLMPLAYQADANVYRQMVK